MKYSIKLWVMGAAIVIKSDIAASEFAKMMIQVLNERGSDPIWAGWYQFTTTDNKEIHVKLRAIDAIEDA